MITQDKLPQVYHRPLNDEYDYWRVHQLLLETVASAPPGFNWDMRRWEGRRFYDGREGGNPDWNQNCQLWETDDGRLVGIVNPDGQGWAHLQVDPDFRHLEGAMIDWAETNLSEAAEDGNGHQLHFFIYDYDALRQRLLSERGYEKMSYGGVIRHLRFGQQPLAQPEMAAGYTLRTTDPENLDDCQKIADLLNAAFRRDFHTAVEYQWFTRNAPSFRRELDLVAVAPDGNFAAYVGIPWDEMNRRGIFEPVCTHPDHQQRGLGKALMQEGLLRLKAMGALHVTVETGDMIPANALYNSLGFTEIYKGYYWRKVF